VQLARPLLLFIASYSAVLRAQSTNASVAGHVTNPSKAALEDATRGPDGYNLTKMAAGRLWHRN